jgi:hypothetical protein
MLVDVPFGQSRQHSRRLFRIAGLITDTDEVAFSDRLDFEIRFQSVYGFCDLLVLASPEQPTGEALAPLQATDQYRVSQYVVAQDEGSF